MPRKKISRALPPLPSNTDLDDALHKTERLTEILRRVALKNQRTQPRAFYSVRDVAGSFHVTLSTASNAYRHLEQEGLLTRVRGSKTLFTRAALRSPPRSASVPWDCRHRFPCSSRSRLIGPSLSRSGANCACGGLPRRW